MSKTSEMLKSVEDFLATNNYRWKRDYNYIDVSAEGKIVERIFTYAVCDKFGEPIAFIDYSTKETLKWANDDLLSAKYIYYFQMKKIEERIKRKIILISEDMALGTVLKSIKQRLDSIDKSIISA